MENMESGTQTNRNLSKKISSIGSNLIELSKNNGLSENIENGKAIDLKCQYDGLTDIDGERPIEKNNIENYTKTNKNTINFKNAIYNVSNKLSTNGSHDEPNSDLSSSGENSLEESDGNSNTETSEGSEFAINETTKFDIRELKPMETLTWLRDHGMGKMANLISKEKEDSTQQKAHEDSILGLYNVDIKNQDHEYLKKLFMTSLGKTYNIDFENERIVKNRLEDSEDFNNDYKEINTIENLRNTSAVQSVINETASISKFIKPKLINRMEVTEEGISGENALAFQKYIRDLQEEVKMKDEKLRLREMERDNARLTRDQLTRAVKSSLELGNGVGNLDYVFKNIIKRNLVYSFRILQLQARINLKNKLGCEIFAGASLLKHIILKRLKYAFRCLNTNAISKNDDLFWKKNIVNAEEVASSIISKFKNILPCYKLSSIVQHNHICALKKFFYIWTKCSGLKSNTTLDMGYNPFRKRGIITLRELKIEVESDLKNLSSKDKRKLNKANKGFFTDTSIDELRKSNLVDTRNLANKEILRNINDKLSLIPNEKLNFLSMIISNNKEQRNIDIARSNALDHFSEIIYSAFDRKDSFKSSCGSTLNKISDIIINYKDKLKSSFENLVLDKDKLDVVDEIKKNAKSRFRQPVKVPDFIEEEHLKLLEDFYSNPFYHIFVNEYNKRIFLGYNSSSSSSDEDEFENYQVEVDEGENGDECDLFYFNFKNENKQLTVQKQAESNVNIDPELPVPLEITKTEDLYIQDEEEQFETVYYYDPNYLQIYQDYSQKQFEDQNIESQVYEQGELQEEEEDKGYFVDKLGKNIVVQGEYTEVPDLSEYQVENWQAETETQNEYFEYTENPVENSHVYGIAESENVSTFK
ncbi:hypothetical protein FG386_000895 [Cryptosporidium ryanae]|uniref:uncharacterized protein n=1 Tax=Cryptosporidium ryanae TaxID=515981 RepID=UPI00351A06FC|nr:hypothetical protein FG386_000895 [Cryptosporidium ryanae]